MSFQKQLLRGVISDTALPLGATPNGSAWCTKALHPSDQELPTGGLPYPNSLPSAVLHFNSKFKISPPITVGAGDTWGCDILTRPDPCNFGCVYKAKTGFIEPLPARTLQPPEFFLNNQVGTSDPDPFVAYAAKAQFFRQNVQMYRINYAGVTLTADGPDLANAGMLSATQYPLVERILSGTNNDTRAGVVSPDYFAAQPLIACLPTEQFPSFDTLQNMPGVYSGKSKEGCYVPHHLSEQDFEWKSPEQSTYYHGTYDTKKNVDTYTSFNPLNISAASGFCHPIHPVNDCILKGDATWIYSNGMLLPTGTWNMSHMSLRGLASTTTVYVQYRVAFELVVKPGSNYSPQVTKPPLSDPSAITSYFAIVRLLADAYPESYNSLGTILSTIASVASEVLPIVLPMVKKGFGALNTLINPSTSSSPDKRAQQNAKRIEQAGKPRSEPTGGGIAELVSILKSKSRDKPRSSRKKKKSSK